MQNKGFLPFEVASRILIQPVCHTNSFNDYRFAACQIATHSGNLFPGKFNVFCNQLSCYFPILYFNIIYFAKRFCCFNVLSNLELSTPQRRKFYLHLESYGRIPLRSFGP